MIKNCKLGKGVIIPHKNLVNLYGAEIGAESFVAPFVEIGKGVVIGENSRISSHSYICPGVEIGNNVFIGHGVVFCNDLYPKANNKNWKLEKTYVGDGSSIGSNSTVLPVKIGKNVLIGAGSIITHDIPDNTIMINPKKIVYKKHD